MVIFEFSTLLCAKQSDKPFKTEGALGCIGAVGDVLASLVKAVKDQKSHKSFWRSQNSLKHIRTTIIIRKHIEAKKLLGIKTVSNE